MGLSSTIVICILWGTLSTISILEYLPVIAKLNPTDKIVAFIVFAIGGPVFGINEILTTILDLIFPEGWDNDGDQNFFN